VCKLAVFPNLEPLSASHWNEGPHAASPSSALGSPSSAPGAGGAPTRSCVSGRLESRESSARRSPIRSTSSSIIPRSSFRSSTERSCLWSRARRRASPEGIPGSRGHPAATWPPSRADPLVHALFHVGERACNLSTPDDQHDRIEARIPRCRARLASAPGAGTHPAYSRPPPDDATVVLASHRRVPALRVRRAFQKSLECAASPIIGGRSRLVQRRLPLPLPWIPGAPDHFVRIEEAGCSTPRLRRPASATAPRTASAASTASWWSRTSARSESRGPGKKRVQLIRLKPGRAAVWAVASNAFPAPRQKAVGGLDARRLTVPFDRATRSAPRKKGSVKRSGTA